MMQRDAGHWAKAFVCWKCEAPGRPDLRHIDGERSRLAYSITFGRIWVRPADVVALGFKCENCGASYTFDLTAPCTPDFWSNGPPNDLDL